MPHSRISLRASFLAGVTAISFLTACGDSTPKPQPVRSSQTNETSESTPVYSDMASCRESYTEEDCRNYQLVAEEEHVRSAPRFETQNTCEAQFGPGHCQTVRKPDGGSAFIPAMAGFVVGGLIGAAIGNAVNRPRAPQPIYYGAPQNGGQQTIYSGAQSYGQAVVPAPNYGSPRPTPVRISPPPPAITPRQAPPPPPVATNPTPANVPVIRTSPAGGAIQAPPAIEGSVRAPETPAAYNRPLPPAPAPSPAPAPRTFSPPTASPSLPRPTAITPPPSIQRPSTTYSSPPRPTYSAPLRPTSTRR